MQSELVAVKFEQCLGWTPMLLSEYNAYKAIGEVEGIPRCKGFGKSGRSIGLVMDYVGPSLKEALKESKRFFSEGKVAYIAQELIRIVKEVHRSGYVHGDITSCNITLSSNKVYLIDFGSATRYISPTTGKHRRQTLSYPVCSPLFASLNAHAGYSPSRRDDMESIAYVLLHLLWGGKMAWATPCMRCSSPEKELQLIGAVKSMVNVDMINDIYDIPGQFTEFLQDARSMAFTDEPDYDKWIDTFRELQEKLRYE